MSSEEHLSQPQPPPPPPQPHSPIPSPPSSSDLPSMFSSLSNALTALKASPQVSPVRNTNAITTAADASSRPRHDSDDNMQKEEERLLDSTQKLKELMQETGASFYDAEEGVEEEDDDDSTHTRARMKRDMSISASPTSLQMSQYWDCGSDRDDDDDAGGDGHIHTHTHTHTSTSISNEQTSSFMTPSPPPCLPERRASSIKDATAVAPIPASTTSTPYTLCRTPSAFSLPPASPSSSSPPPLRQQQQAQINGDEYQVSSSKFAAEVVMDEHCFDIAPATTYLEEENKHTSSSPAVAVKLLFSPSASISSSASFSTYAAAAITTTTTTTTMTTRATMTETDISEEQNKDMHEVSCATERLSELSTQQRFSGLRGITSSFSTTATASDTYSSSSSTNPTLGEPALALSSSSSSSSSTLCRHLALIALRPDVKCNLITDLLIEIAKEQGLLVTKRQGSHVVAELPESSSTTTTNTHTHTHTHTATRWEWRSIDMQVVLDRQTHDRILLVRFLMTANTGAAAGGNTGGGPAAATEVAEKAEARRHRPATRRFLTALQRKLFAAKVNKRALLRFTAHEEEGEEEEDNDGGLASSAHALAPSPTPTATITTPRSCKYFKLDAQYLTQLEDLAREDMNKQLEHAARQLEDYVRAAETKCDELKELMEPMFMLHKLQIPTLGKPLPLSCYPLDLLNAYEQQIHKGADAGSSSSSTTPSTPPTKTPTHTHPHPSSPLILSPLRRTGASTMRIGAEEETPPDCLACMNALQDKAWRGYLAQCDAEMTARMQRKNLQVLDRMTKVSDYQRGLLQTLRDSKSKYRMAVPLVNFGGFAAGGAGGGGIGRVKEEKNNDNNVEAPLYYCRCIVGGRPATLYVTYLSLFFIGSLPMSTWNRQISFRGIKGISLSSSRLGVGMQFQLAKAIEVEVVGGPKMESAGTPGKGGGSSSSPRGGGGGGGGGSSTGTTPRSSIGGGKGGKGGKEGGGRKKNDVLVFSTTTEPEKLIDLLRLLQGLNGKRGEGEEEEDEEEEEEEEGRGKGKKEEEKRGGSAGKSGDGAGGKPPKTPLRRPLSPFFLMT